MAKMLKPEEVAKLCGCSKITIYKMVNDGKIPHVRIGRNVKFHPESIEKWLRGGMKA